jgi:ATP-dependent DNA helicase RecQ
LQDVVRLRQMQDGTGVDAEHKRVERHKLDALLAWCEATTCRRQPLLEYFGEHLTEPCGNCDNCLEPPASWDASEDAQKLLSCVYRSGQRYGAAHVIDVLRGTDTDKVRRAGHQALSTFGIGAAASVNHWRSVLRQLLVQGAVQVDVENFGAIKLGVAARGILRGECRVRMRQDVSEGRAKRAPAPIASGAVPEQAVWERLRECRRRLASAQGVPPYVIFHDRTLVEMAVQKPSTLAELLTVSGVGQAKLARYGAAFLAALHDHGPSVPVVSSQTFSG